MSEHTTNDSSKAIPTNQIIWPIGPGIHPLSAGSEFTFRELLRVYRIAGADVIFTVGFFGQGFFVGTGSGPLAVSTTLVPADKTVFRPIAPTRIAIARASAPSLRDIVPPWNW